MNFIKKLTMATFFVVISTTTLTFGDIIFYGATRINVPVNTTVNVRTNAFYRVLARCDFDGDITHRIQIVSGAPNNVVSTAAQGTQNVVYSVENSRGDVETITVPVAIGAAGSTIVVRRTVYTLPESVIEAIQIGDARRGDNQDVQHLGLFMPANSTLRMRRITEFPQAIQARAFTGTREGDNVRDALVWCSAG
ncbi:MAG: hypothetical protein FWE23_02980 [Chitinivibrionia bacterium]|nr:hypothetical protein [Chitinivibrionia bacterium]